jgi:hypothetical protein
MPSIKIVHIYRITVCAVRQSLVQAFVTCARYFNWTTRLQVFTALVLYFTSFLNHHHPLLCIGAGRTDVDIDLIRNGVSLWEKQLHMLWLWLTRCLVAFVTSLEGTRTGTACTQLFTTSYQYHNKVPKCCHRYRDWRVNHVDVSALIFKRADQVQCCGQRMRLVGQCELL